MTKNKHPLIGLFGGTFNPIHKGHTKAAEELLNALKLDVIHFIPNKEPVCRQKPEVDATHRLAMVRIAIAKNPKFILNDLELHRSGPSYTIDTLMDIRKKMPEQPLCLILGKDAFSKMNNWHEWEAIPKLVHLISIYRQGAQLPHVPWMQTLLEEREINDAEKLHSKPGGYIFQYEMEPIMISGTEIRKKLKAGESVSNEIDTDVLHYIQQHCLYV